MNKMRDLSRKTRQKVDDKFKEREAQLLSETALDIEKLKPDLSDDDYAALSRVVAEATERNESLAKLKGRLEELGEQGQRILEKLAEKL